MDDTHFETIRNAPMHLHTPQDWRRWYADITPYLADGDRQVRWSAVERLSTAVFWAECSGEGRLTPDLAGEQQERLRWLLGLIERASQAHPDVMVALFHNLRYHGDSEPFPAVLIPWLEGLLESPPPMVPADRIEGTMLLIGGLPAWEGSLLPPQFDHPSDYVRACSAYLLGQRGYDGLSAPAFMAALTEAELARPGVAGPWWSSTGLDVSDPGGLPFDPRDWMLTIIEKRQRPEPEGMPFNGIDFHVHELAADDPEAIRRLFAAGRIDLALMTATEIRDRVDILEPVLVSLGNHDNPEVAFAAQAHLALYYGYAHSRADRERILHRPDWRPGANAFVVCSGGPGDGGSTAAYFPTAGLFDDATAWAIVDEALPPDLRGALVAHALAEHGAPPAPCLFGLDELRQYGSGAEIRFIGQVGEKGWRRLEVHGRRLGTRWRPLAGVCS